MWTPKSPSFQTFCVLKGFICTIPLQKFILSPLQTVKSNGLRAFLVKSIVLSFLCSSSLLVNYGDQQGKHIYASSARYYINDLLLSKHRKYYRFYCTLSTVMRAYLRIISHSLQILQVGPFRQQWMLRRNGSTRICPGHLNLLMM